MPSDAGEAIEIRIVGVNYRFVLHSKSGDVGVRNEIRAAAAVGKNAPEMGQVTAAWIERRYVRMAEPVAYASNRFRCRQ